MNFDINAQTLTLSLDGAIDTSTVQNTDLRLEAVTGNEPVPEATIISGTDYSDPPTIEWAITSNPTGYLSGMLADGNYRAVVGADDIKDTDGNSLAGDIWTDFYFLQGDLNGDRVVDTTDYLTCENNSGMNNADYTDGDFNYDDVIDNSDVAIVSHKYSTSLPAPPSVDSITAGNQTSSSMELNWVDSVNGELGYRVQRSSDGQNFDWYINLPANTTTYTDPALADGTRYWWRVRAYGNGEDTAYTPKQGGTTLLPGPQQSVSMEKNGTTASIAWADNSQNESNFDIDISSDGGTTWSLATSAGANTTFTDIGGLSANVDYLFRVQARNSQTTSAETPSTAVQPAPPTGVSATSVQNGIALSWTDNSARETGFIIERAPGSDPSNFTQVGQVGADVTSFTDTTAEPGVPYVYRVQTIAGDASSVWSAPVQSQSGPGAFYQYNTPSRQPPYVEFDLDAGTVPSGALLSLTNLTTGQPVTGAVMTTGTWSGGASATFTFPGFSNGVLPDGNYYAVLADASQLDMPQPLLNADFFAFGGDANHDRTVDVTDLGILATNWQGTGKTFSQGDFNYDGTVDVTDLGTLATNWQKLVPSPTFGMELTATPISTEDIDFFWTPVTGADSYRIDISDDGGTTFYESVTLDASTPVAVGDGLFPDQTFSFKVTAVSNSSGDLASSNVVTATSQSASGSAPVIMPSEQLPDDPQPDAAGNKLLVAFNGTYIDFNLESVGNRWFEQIVEDDGDSIKPNQANNSAAYTFHTSDISVALGDLLARIDTNHDLVISSTEANANKIVVMGYSWGGINAANFAVRLKEDNILIETGSAGLLYHLSVDIPVTLLVTLDPVNDGPARLFRWVQGGGIDVNVARFENYYQRRGGTVQFDLWNHTNNQDFNPLTKLPGVHGHFGDGLSFLLKGAELPNKLAASNVLQLNINTLGARMATNFEWQEDALDPFADQFDTDLGAQGIEHLGLPWYMRGGTDGSFSTQYNLLYELAHV